MLKFAQFCNFLRALGKINVFRNCSSDILGWRFSEYFLKDLGFWGSFSYKKFSYVKKGVVVDRLVVAKGKGSDKYRFFLW